MADILTGAVAVLVFVLLSMRPPTSEARTPADYRALARRAGWAGCLLGALRIGLVVALLVLNDACRIGLHIVQAARTLLGALACAVLQTRRPAVGGA